MRRPLSRVVGRRLIGLAAAALLGLDAPTAAAQRLAIGAADTSVITPGSRAVTRREAIAAALVAGTRVALAASDTAAARARLATARMVPNPTLTGIASKAVPQRHLTLDLPLDPPWLRRARVAAAAAGRRATRLRFLSERAAAVLEVDTSYTRALAAAARLRLSRQTARDADSLLRMAAARRDAGDASDLDVDLAAVVAGQQGNVAAADALTLTGALLTVQTLMGIRADAVVIAPADSLVPPGAGGSPADGGADTAVVAATGAPLLPSGPAAAVRPPLTVAAAAASLRAAELAVTRERRSIFVLPSLQIGAEYGDPTGAEPGLLPTIGLAVPLPLWNRNAGPIAEAGAARDRAVAELAAAQIDAQARLTAATRQRAVLLGRVARDRALVDRAERVAARSLAAYREGAFALPAVLETRRSAREVLAQYIDDVAALLIASAELQAVAQSAPQP